MRSPESCRHASERARQRTRFNLVETSHSGSGVGGGRGALLYCCWYALRRHSNSKVQQMYRKNDFFLK